MGNNWAQKEWRRRWEQRSKGDSVSLKLCFACFEYGVAFVSLYALDLDLRPCARSNMQHVFYSLIHMVCQPFVAHTVSNLCYMITFNRGILIPTLTDTFFPDEWATKILKTLIFFKKSYGSKRGCLKKTTTTKKTVIFKPSPMTRVSTACFCLFNLPRAFPITLWQKERKISFSLFPFITWTFKMTFVFHRFMVYSLLQAITTRSLFCKI